MIDFLVVSSDTYLLPPKECLMHSGGGWRHGVYDIHSGSYSKELLGQKVVCACCGGKLRTHWRVRVRDAVKLKKRPFRLSWPRGLLHQQTGTARPQGG